MTMYLSERKALYAFGCPNHQATIQRLRLLTALTPDPRTKNFFSQSHCKVE